MPRLASSLALLSLLLSPGLAASSRAETPGTGIDEVRECAKRNAPNSVRGEGALERTDAQGHTERKEATLFWKRDAKDLSRFLVRIEAPPDERGSMFLVLQREGGGEDIWSYLPDLGKVRRITSRSVSGQLFGTDFSYEDVVVMQSAASRAGVERLADAELEGRPVYVLSVTPAPDTGSAYTRIVSRIDRQTCMLLEAELYGHADTPNKRLKVAVSDLEQHGQRWLPKKVVLQDLEGQSESRLVIEKATWDAEIPDRLFSESELTKGH